MKKRFAKKRQQRGFLKGRESSGCGAVLAEWILNRARATRRAVTGQAQARGFVGQRIFGLCVVPWAVYLMVHVRGSPGYLMGVFVWRAITATNGLSAKYPRHVPVSYARQHQLPYILYCLGPTVIMLYPAIHWPVASWWCSPSFFQYIEQHWKKAVRA